MSEKQKQLKYTCTIARYSSNRI